MSTAKEMKDTAEFNHVVELARINEVHEIAMRIAPGFRDKFDLSEGKKHFDQWADLAWTGAEAFLDRKIKATREANKARERENEKADVQALKESKGGAA